MRSRIGKTVVSGGEEFLTCEEVITFLLDYLSRETSIRTRRATSSVTSRCCPSCAAYLATYEQTVRLGRAALREELESHPPELGGELVRAILESRRQS